MQKNWTRTTKIGWPITWPSTRMRPVVNTLDHSLSVLAVSCFRLADRYKTTSSRHQDNFIWVLHQQPPLVYANCWTFNVQRPAFNAGSMRASLFSFWLSHGFLKVETHLKAKKYWYIAHCGSHCGLTLWDETFVTQRLLTPNLRYHSTCRGARLVKFVSTGVFLFPQFVCRAQKHVYQHSRDIQAWYCRPPAVGTGMRTYFNENTFNFRWHLPQALRPPLFPGSYNAAETEVDPGCLER